MIVVGIVALVIGTTFGTVLGFRLGRVATDSEWRHALTRDETDEAGA